MLQDRDFYDKESLWEYIGKKVPSDGKTVVITHNAAFDLLASGGLTLLEKMGLKMTFFYDHGMVFIMSLRRGRGNLTIISNTNFYPTSIKKLGGMLGLEKLECDIENVGDRELLKYCRRDVDILYKSFKSWEGMITKYDLGMLRLTKASQAFTTYTYKFMKFNIYVHLDEEAQGIERDSYCGGRVETFRIGEFKDKEWVKLDYNSNYAYVMKRNHYPVQLQGILQECDEERLKEVLASFLCIARVQVKTDIPVYPIKEGGKLIFPIGTFTTTLCTRGLAEAIKRKHLVGIDVVCCYSSEKIFEDYVDFFYSKKLEAQREGNLIKRTIYKDLLNSLYGKFAERHPLTTFEDVEEGAITGGQLITYPDGKRKVVEPCFCGRVIKQGELTNTKHTLTAISSHVTENARWLLWDLIEKIGYENVLYCDTDSVIVGKEHIKSIEKQLDNERLGALAIEAETNYVKINAPKDYIFGSEVKRKGIPARAVEIRPNEFEYDEFQGIRSRLKDKDLSQAATNTIVKKPTYVITKGKLQPNGLVLPFVLPQDENLL
jgi:hypothetical protein